MECTSMTIQVNKIKKLWTNLPRQRMSTMIVFLFSTIKRGNRLHDSYPEPQLVHLLMTKATLVTVTFLHFCFQAIAFLSELREIKLQ